MAELIKQNKCHGGFVRQYKHESTVLGCSMKFSVFFPPEAETRPVPVLYFLSGLTCTDENFMQKAGAQRVASEHDIAIVTPDTSPRGLGIPGEEDSWDFGTGAGFYLNATAEPWSKNYQMYDYILNELPATLRGLDKNLDVETASIFGHSMGGHGALTLALRNPASFKSTSALAPICNPSKVPWGQKAFRNYLGANEEEWKQYDATELVSRYSGPSFEVLIDTGTDDEFLKEQLHPWAFEEAAAGKLHVKSNLRVGYDHSYFFIATFVEEHIKFHAKHLKKE
ncbi:hypothetical protein Ndes2526B_g03191 [Nannochloris sp. 'desiccata']